MYKKLSKVFVSTISIFSLGFTPPVYANENLIQNNSSIQNSQNVNSRVVVKDEQALIDALKNDSVNEVVVEGNITIVKNIDLKDRSTDVKIIVGSQEVLDSSLILVQGAKINGAGKLSILKSNDAKKSMIDFKKVASSGQPSQTVLRNLNLFGKLNETAINNTIDNLLLNNITVENLSLFENPKTDTQFLENINFVTSSLDFKSSVGSITSNSVEIKISKNSLEEKYYPLHLILKFKGNEFKKVQIPNPSSEENGNIILNITGLKENLDYTYEIVSYVNGNDPLIIDKGNFKTLQSEIVSGENDIQSNILNFTLPQENMEKSSVYDTGINIDLSEKIKNYAKDGNNFEINLKGVNVKYEDGKFLIDKLIPSKEYSNLKIEFDIQGGRKGIVSIPKFTTGSKTTNLNQFIKDVYFNALNRDPDEVGFWYWVDKLSSRETTAEKFVKNLLNEQEFVSIRPGTRSKIEGLYKVIVNRNSDKEGLEFWVNIYDSLVKDGYSDELALRVVADKMINEDEFKDIIRKSMI